MTEGNQTDPSPWIGSGLLACERRRGADAFKRSQRFVRRGVWGRDPRAVGSDSVLAQNEGRRLPTHVLDGDLDVRFRADNTHLSGRFQLGQGVDSILLNVDMDRRGRIAGVGSFRTATLLLSGRVKRNRVALKR